MGVKKGGGDFSQPLGETAHPEHRTNPKVLGRMILYLCGISTFIWIKGLVWVGGILIAVNKRSASVDKNDQTTYALDKGCILSKGIGQFGL
jgi:hypothetical protein